MQIDGQAVILAKDLVESVMQRIGVTDYTRFISTVKGAELELLRFTHPFMGFDVPAILGNRVTLDAGTGAVHTAPGHGPDDYVIGQKYGLETANPVCAGRHLSAGHLSDAGWRERLQSERHRRCAAAGKRRAAAR
ncbi:hypothetical protein ACLB1S_04740 [Escherichia coli]